jgi:hypothetical protein
MSNVPPAAPPQATGAITSSPNSQEGLSQQQQNAGQRQAGAQVPKETAPPPASPAVSIAASIAGLREGMRFKGTMMGSDANGLPVLRTPNGTFILSQSLEQLVLNGEVDIEIRVAGNKITALILSIAGKAQHPPKEVGLTMTSVSGAGPDSKMLAGGLAAGPAPRGGQTATINIGSQLTATVLNSSGSAAQDTALKAGSTLVLRVSHIALALPKGEVAAPAGSPSIAPPPASSSASGTIQASPSNLANDIKTQLAASQVNAPSSQGLLSGHATKLTGTVPSPTQPVSPTVTAPGQVPITGSTPIPSANQVATPQTIQGTNSAVVANSVATASPAAGVAAATTPALNAAISQTALLSQQDAVLAQPTAGTSNTVASTIQAEVIGPGRNGGLLVKTAFGEVSLQTKAVLPPGSRLTFETVATRAPESVQRPIAQGQPAPMEGGAIAPETKAAVKAFAREWPAMKDVLSALQTINPASAQSLIASSIPGANSSLASSILLFLSALRGGDMKGWLGREATTLLERGGHSDLLNRLSSDAAQLGRASDASAQGDWRALPFPLFDGSDLQQIWAFVREHRRSGDQADKKALRFVVELELTALGGMQLDGLIQDKQFDLIVRSSRLLPTRARQDLAGLFESSTEATGFGGSIIFQSDTTWPVSPFREAQQEATGHGEIVA